MQPRRSHGRAALAEDSKVAIASALAGPSQAPAPHPSSLAPTSSSLVPRPSSLAARFAEEIARVAGSSAIVPSAEAAAGAVVETLAGAGATSVVLSANLPL